MEPKLDLKVDIRRGCTSASNAEYDSRCSARHLAQRGIVEPAKSRDATYGSKLHRLLSGEQDIVEMTNLPAAERDVFDACRSIEKRKVIEFFGQDARLRVVREKLDGSTRLWAKIPDGNGGFYEHSGQPDVVYLAPPKALIIEYKTLAGDVPEAPENKQLRDQAVLLMGNVKGLGEIGTVVVQPLVTHDPKICLYTPASLQRAEREMFDRVRASNNPQSPATAGDIQCNFCLAKTSCVAYQRYSGSMVPGMLNILDVPVIAWTPEQCGIFLTNCKTAEKWLDVCRSEIFSRLEKDINSIPGWTLKPGNTKETIIDPQKVFEKFCMLGGKLENFLACIAVGKTKLKDQLSKVTGAKGKSLDDALRTVCDGAVETSQNRPSIVPVDKA